jgi:hypothetical protein
MKTLDPIYRGKKPYKATVMYQYTKQTTIKVQCISTKCGLHKDLKIGEWYDVIDVGDYYQIEDKSIIGYNNYNTYEKSLFRTIDQRRDNKLNKILNV